jgi:AcrR family transcriptional regulator
MKPAMKKSRRRNVRGEGAQLRNEIVAAATTLLSTLGPSDPFSLRAVAKQAGIAAPSVYIHFADLNALLLAVLEELFRGYFAIRSAAVAKAAKAGGGAWEQLLASSLAYVKFGIEHPGHYRVLYEGRVVLRLDDPMSANFGRELQVLTAALIEEIIAERGGAAEKPQDLALLLWASLHGIVSLQINKPTLKWPSAAVLAEKACRALILRPTK